VKKVTLLLALGSLGLLLTSGNAQDANLRTAGQVEFDFLVVQMPEALAISLIPELRDKKRSTKAAERVLELVAEKKATLIGWPVLTTKSGQGAMVEQIDEFRYANQYDPPGRSVITKSLPEESQNPPQGLLVPTPQVESSVETVAGSPTGAAASPIPTGPSKKVLETTTSISEGIPTGFETRNVGITLEIEAFVDQDEHRIDLNHVRAEHVRFLGMRKVEIETKDSKNKGIVEQPEFLTNRVGTSLQVADGEHTLLGVFKLNDLPGQMELFILHTQIQRIEAAQ